MNAGSSRVNPKLVPLLAASDLRSRERIARPRSRGDRIGRGTSAFAWRPADLFRGLLRGHWGPIAQALPVLSAAAAFKVVPPIATKLAVDLVFGGRPVPAGLKYLLPESLSRGGWLASLGPASPSRPSSASG